MNKILDNLIDCIDRAVITDPPHIHLDMPFPEDFYEEILQNLPPDSDYHYFFHPDSDHGDGTSSRLRLILTELPETMSSSLKIFWGKTLNILQSKELENTFRKKFSTTLEERFPENKWNNIPFELVPYLFRDIEAYKINIHPDAGRKVLTIQFYLPVTNTHEYIGTQFHKKISKNDFKKVDQIPFRRNYGYAFPVTNDSWHSVDLIEEKIVRNSIMLVYSLPKRAGIKDNKIYTNKKMKEQDY